MQHVLLTLFSFRDSLVHCSLLSFLFLFIYRYADCACVRVPSLGALGQMVYVSTWMCAFVGSYVSRPTRRHKSERPFLSFFCHRSQCGCSSNASNSSNMSSSARDDTVDIYADMMVESHNASLFPMFQILSCPHCVSEER